MVLKGWEEQQRSNDEGTPNAVLDLGIRTTIVVHNVHDVQESNITIYYKMQSSCFKVTITNLILKVKANYIILYIIIHTNIKHI